ncbi:hypothetical protein [Dactylosporangium darangshiense]
MKLCRTLVIGSLPLAMAACTATPSTPTATGPAYTCCEAADINRDYQPGQTLTVHWIVVPGKLSTGSPAHEVELNARLSGPYATVSDLKTASGQDPAGGSTFTADPIRPSGQTGEQPVSSILIPLAAAPGYYNLITSVTEAPASHGGASVIHVVPKP